MGKLRIKRQQVDVAQIRIGGIHVCDTNRGGTWRKLLADYNKRNRDANPLGLLKAWQLYRHKTYGQLVRQLGEENVYILSAGWGLLPANYLTPLEFWGHNT